MSLRSGFLKLAAFSASTILCTVALAEAISNTNITVKPSRITNRIVLAEQKKMGSFGVQILSVIQGSTGDVSNSLKLILAISQNGDKSSVESNFELTDALTLISANRIGPGIYQVIYIDANISMEPQTRIIDARRAISDMANAKCREFTTCEIKTRLEIKQISTQN